MAHVLFYGTHGTDEPTRAVLPFHMAKGALEAGHTVEIALIGEATYLMKDSIAKEVKGVAVPNAAEIIAELAGKGVSISV
ncbi:MAG: DsrE family protein [Chloroflexi bacterium]|nr:DsrE family protein [Chloroflexota bacterium]